MQQLLKRFDTTAARLVNRLPNWLRRPFDVLGYIFAPPAWMLYIGCYALIVHSRSAALVLALVPLATISKYAFRRQRPPTIYAGGMRVKSYSFPSSHAYAAALAGGYLAFATMHTAALASIVLLLLVIIMGISRVKLGAHYPTDVLAGWLSGLGVAFIFAR